MVGYEVFEGVDALDWVVVVLVGWEEPGVVGFEEGVGGCGVPDVDCVGWVVFCAEFGRVGAFVGDVRAVVGAI